MFARSVGLNVANIGTLAIPNARGATWCESRQQPLGRYRARSFHQPWDSTMKKPLAVAVMALSFAPSCVLAQERAGDAALGALSGAVVLGPVGAVAGAVIGFTAGPVNRSAREAKKNLPLNMAESKTRHEFSRAYNELADLLGDDELMEVEIEHVKAARRDAQRSAKVNKSFESLPLEKREAILADYLSKDPVA